MIRRTVLAGLTATLLVIAMTAGTALAARPVWVFTTQLTGEAERPGPGDLDAHGSATVRVFPETDTVCWVVTWNHVDGTVVAAHIHGPVGTEAPAGVLVPFFMGTAFDSNGMHRGCASAAGWADDIVAEPGMFYVNVHSAPSFGPGAIRGQLG
jgi:xanthine/uracil/vitamin C permease (AzgA family)